MKQEQQNSNVIQRGKVSNGVKGMTVIVKTIASWVKDKSPIFNGV